MNKKDLTEELRRMIKKGSLKQETLFSLGRTGIPRKQMKNRKTKLEGIANKEWQDVMSGWK